MTTYSISLDDVDLALLPVRTRAYNDFLKKEHFQFHVMKDTVLESSFDVTYTCHICAIELPVAFVREHATSIKHRANVRIASEAAERMRAHITALPPTPTAQPTACFCTNCATTVDEGHDRTKEHRVAVMHDNLLWELMKAYVGDDDESKDEVNQNAGKNKILKGDQEKKLIGGIKDDERNKSNSPIVSPVTENQQTSQTKHKTENTEPKAMQHTVNCEINDKDKEDKNEGSDKVAIINKTENNQSTNSVLHTTSRWVKNETKNVIENGTVKNEDTKTVKEPYEKELLKFMDTNNVFQIKEIYHRVHLKTNDDTVNVYSDHFHSFHRMYYKNNGKVECIVCNKTFDEKDTEAHKYDFNHMTAVVKIGDDGNYVRKINETHSHCILCNQKIHNINVAKHKQSQHHTMRKTNNVKSNAAKTKETKTEKNNNEVTDKTEDNPLNKDDKMDETVEINKHPYKEKSGELWCVVCECRVPRDLTNRQDHLKGLRHRNNLFTK